MSASLAISNSSPLKLFSYLGQHSDEVLGQLRWHATLSILPVVAGTIIALPLGYWARRFRWVYPPLIGLTGLLYTIPSIALFVVIPAVVGTKALSWVNVAIALTIYTVALMSRTIADGLASVPEDVALSGTAMGYTRLQRLRKVELPIAVPVIAAGLRVATVSNVSIVAIAGFIGIENLGQLFVTSFQLSSGSGYYPPVTLGIVLCVLLALVLDGLIVVGNRLASPWRRVEASR